MNQEVTKSVVYLGCPIAPSYISPNAGGGGLRGLSQWAHGAQTNFGDLTPYLTYGMNKYIFTAGEDQGGRAQHDFSLHVLAGISLILQ
jgi:hypothetical protein